MQENLIVVNSDAINRDGYRFSIGALEDILFKNTDKGVPACLGHDLYKPVGWNIPFGLFIEPGLSRVLAKLILPENEKEEKQISLLHNNTVAHRYQSACEPFKETLFSLLDGKLSGNQLMIHCGCASVKDESIVKRAFPSFLQYLDKDGLVYLSDLLKEFKYLEHGVFQHIKSGLAIFSHPYFRRSFSRHNNFHYKFLDELMALSSLPKVTVRIALDWDLIGYAPDFKPALELEYWFGPKYDDNISGIKPEVTKYHSNDFQRMYYGVSGMEFWWKSNDSEMTQELEAEELRDTPAPTIEDMYCCRYVHSIYDSRKKSFKHFDGAIRMYPEETMLERIDKNINKAGKQSFYTKLFRVDGQLPLANWKSLVTNYYQDNPLVHEYFGEDFRGVYAAEEKPKEPLKPQETLVPYKMDSGNGFRMLISYHQKNESENSSSSHVVVSSDELQFKVSKVNVIEFDFIEVIKSFRRLGIEVELPRDFEWVITEDLYLNLPNIHHGGDNVSKNLGQTLQALKAVIDGIVKKGMEKIISFSISFPVQHLNARISVAGPVADIQQWLLLISEIPLERKSFNQWVEKQGAWLKEKFPNLVDLPPLSELVQMDGMLFFKRRSVQPEIQIKLKTKDGGIGYEMAIPKEMKPIADAVERGEISLVANFLSPVVICSKTKEDYLKSQFSSALDDGIYQIIKGGDVCGLSWTDKPAFKQSH